LIAPDPRAVVETGPPHALGESR